jgi:hypothetical protein
MHYSQTHLLFRCRKRERVSIQILCFVNTQDYYTIPGPRCGEYEERRRTWAIERVRLTVLFRQFGLMFRGVVDVAVEATVLQCLNYCVCILERCILLCIYLLNTDKTKKYTIFKENCL